MTRTLHRGRWTVEDRAQALHRYLPIDVAPGSAGLRVRLDYDRTAGALDLGCVGPDGFRGWSGEARREFVIAPGHATPGYLSGELEPGVWFAVVALHRIPDSGLAFTLTAETGPVPAPLPTLEPPRPDRPPRRELPAAPGRRWLAGDLHTHTEHSDGVLTVPELACLGAVRGLDFLAVTDHNTISHQPLLPAAGRHAGIVLLPGQEVTTERGHANCLGDIGWVDFREPARCWLEETERRGGLLSVNHPVRSDDCAWRHPMPRRPPLAEVWHASWTNRRDGSPIAWWLAWIGAGSDPSPGRVTAVGGSDYHRPGAGAAPGYPTTWVECEDQDQDDVAAVFAGLHAGRAAVSAHREGPVLLRIDDELVAVDAGGTVLADPEGRRRPVRGPLARFAGAPGPHWLETGESEVLALTS